MSASELMAEVRRWLRYACEDLAAAEALVGSPDAAPRHACFLAQQAAEKALKAVLVYSRVEFPFRHDLDTLRDLVPTGWHLKQEHPDLAGLTEWAVEARYPGDWPDPTEADARNAANQARAVWESVLRDLEGHGFDVGATP
ncbi:MAG: HEPN domain-containing protein [Chloroflexi bacterium]|nr:HEPN domain-containing protein [Chloroflexota bacterium]